MKKMIAGLVLITVIFSFCGCGAIMQTLRKSSGQGEQTEQFSLGTKVIDDTKAIFTFEDKQWKQTKDGGEWDLHCEYGNKEAYLGVFLYPDDGTDPTETFQMQMDEIMANRENPEMVQEETTHHKDGKTITATVYKAERDGNENYYYFRLIQDDNNPDYYCFSLATSLLENRGVLDLQLEDILFSMTLVEQASSAE